jgi:hypothetical protein
MTVSETTQCDMCNTKDAIGECCCGVDYCGIACQERHLDEVHEDADGMDEATG